MVSKNCIILIFLSFLFSCKNKNDFIFIRTSEISADSLFNLAKLQYDRQEYLASYLIFSIYKEKYHYNCNDDYYIACSLMELGKYDEAEVFCDLSKNCDQLSKDKLYNLIGTLKVAKGDYQNAYHYFQKAIELNPKEGLYFNNLGATLSVWKPNETETICKILNVAIKLGDSSSLAYYIYNCDMPTSSGIERK